MLLTKYPRYDVDMCTQNELYLVEAAPLEDELQTIVVFAV